MGVFVEFDEEFGKWLGFCLSEISGCEWEVVIRLKGRLYFIFSVFWGGLY